MNNIIPIFFDFFLYYCAPSVHIRSYDHLLKSFIFFLRSISLYPDVCLTLILVLFLLLLQLCISLLGFNMSIKQVCPQHASHYWLSSLSLNSANSKIFLPTQNPRYYSLNTIDRVPLNEEVTNATK